MDIYLIRHTKSLIEPGVCYGSSDLELAPSFTKELKLLKAKLTGVSALKVISSPLKRCTALARELSPSIKTDHRLAEMHFGEWELMEWQKIMADYEDIYNKWQFDFVNIGPPGGETYLEQYKRCTPVIDEVIKANDGDYAIVSHGGIIRALIAHILELPLEKAFRVGIDLGSVTKIIVNGQLRTIQYVNK